MFGNKFEYVVRVCRLGDDGKSPSLVRRQSLSLQTKHFKAVRGGDMRLILGSMRGRNGHSGASEGLNHILDQSMNAHGCFALFHSPETHLVLTFSLTCCSLLLFDVGTFVSMQ